jgi:hypothetical protein
VWLVEYSRIVTFPSVISIFIHATLLLPLSSSIFNGTKCRNNKALISPHEFRAYFSSVFHSFFTKFVLMLTSYNLIRSHFRRSHRHWFCTIVALKPEPQPPPTTTTSATTTTTTSNSFPSKRFLLLGFDSRRHIHHTHHYSFHRSAFFLLLLIFSIIDYFSLFIIFSLSFRFLYKS